MKQGRQIVKIGTTRAWFLFLCIPLGLPAIAMAANYNYNGSWTPSTPTGLVNGDTLTVVSGTADTSNIKMQGGVQIYNNAILTTSSPMTFDTAATTPGSINFINNGQVSTTSNPMLMNLSASAGINGANLNLVNNQASFQGNINVGPAGGLLTFHGNDALYINGVPTASQLSSQVNSTVNFASNNATPSSAIVIDGQFALNGNSSSKSNYQFLNANSVTVQGTGSTFLVLNGYTSGGVPLSTTSSNGPLIGIANFNVGNANASTDTNVRAILAAPSAASATGGNMYLGVNTTNIAANGSLLVTVLPITLTQPAAPAPAATLSNSVNLNGLINNLGTLAIQNYDNYQFANLTGDALNNSGLVTGSGSLNLSALTVGSATTVGIINNLSALTVSGPLNLIAGQISGVPSFSVTNAVTVSPGAATGFNFNNSLTGYSAFTIASGAILNLGPLGDLSSGTVTLNGTLNLAGGKLSSVIGAAGSRLNVTANSQISGALQSIDTLTVNSGITLTVPQGLTGLVNLNGTLNVASQLGSVVGSNASIVNITGNTSLTTNASISSLGTLDVQSGTFTVAGEIAGVTNFNVSPGASVTLNSNGIINNALSIQGTPANPSGLNLAGGTISGALSTSGNVTISLTAGNLPAVNGTSDTLLNIGNMSTTAPATTAATTAAINAIGSVNIGGGSAATFTVKHALSNISSFTLQNNGTLNVNDAGSIAIPQGATLNVLSGGNLQINSGGIISGGTLNLLSGASASLNVNGSLNSPVVLNGSASAATLALNGGYLNGALTATGTTTVNVTRSSATNSPISGVNTLEVKVDSTNPSGTNFSVNSAVLNYNNLIIDSTTNLTLNALGLLKSTGTIQNNGTLIFNGGSINSAMSGTGNFMVPSGVTALVQNDINNSGSFTNQGTTIISGVGRKFTGSNFHCTSGSTLEFSISSPSNYDSLIATNIVALDAGTAIKINLIGDPEYLTTGTPFTLINAMSLTTGPMAITPISSSGVLYFSPGVINANKLTVTVLRKSYQSIATTPSATNVASVLENLRVNNPSAPLIQTIKAIDSLPTVAAINTALSQLAPVTHGGQLTGARAAQSQALDKVATRLDFLRAQQNITVARGQGGYAAGDPLTDQAAYTPMFFANWAQQKNQAGLSGYTARTVGLGLLSDTMVAPGIRLGLGGSYGLSQVVNLDNKSNATRIDNFQAMAYASYDEGGFFADMTGALAHNRYNGQRTIDFIKAVARQNYHGQQYALSGRAGYSYLFNELALVPTVAAYYTRLKQQAYVEAGAGNQNLRVQASSNISLKVGLGLKINYLSVSHSDDVTADTHFMLYRETKTDVLQYNTQFLGGGAAFKSQGLRPVQNSANIGGSLSFVTLDNSLWSMTYDAELKKGFISHSAFIKFRFAY